MTTLQFNRNQLIAIVAGTDPNFEAVQWQPALDALHNTYHMTTEQIAREVIPLMVGGTN